MWGWTALPNQNFVFSLLKSFLSKRWTLNLIERNLSLWVFPEMSVIYQNYSTTKPLPHQTVSPCWAPHLPTRSLRPSTETTSPLHLKQFCQVPTLAPKDERDVVMGSCNNLFLFILQAWYCFYFNSTRWTGYSPKSNSLHSNLLQIADWYYDQVLSISHSQLNWLKVSYPTVNQYI